MDISREVATRGVDAIKEAQASGKEFTYYVVHHTCPRCGMRSCEVAKDSKTILRRALRRTKPGWIRAVTFFRRVWA